MKTILTFLLAGILIPSLAQVSTEKRIELELNDDYTSEKIYDFGKKGFILFAKSETKEDKQYKWKFDHYSTDLEKDNSVEIMLPKKYVLDETFRTDEIIYQLFKDDADFKIISMDVATLEYDILDIELEKKTYISGFAILNNYAYMTAIKNREQFILAINLKNKERNFHPITIEGFKSKNIKIENMQILNDSKEIFVFLEAIVSKKLSKTYVVRLDDQGGEKGGLRFLQKFY